MPFAEDLAAFTSTTEFASACTLNGAPLSVIFDAAYIDVQDLVSTARPVAQAASDVVLACVSPAATPRGALLVVAGRTYKVTEHEPDGTGWCLLKLHLQ